MTLRDEEKNALKDVLTMLGIENANQQSKMIDGKSIKIEGISFEYVKFLHLHNRKLNGSISELVGKLIMIETIDLSNSILTGSIPKSLLDLSYLKDLNLSKNQLSSSIPDFKSDRLEFINLSSNQLTGSVPNSIKKLNRLKKLDLSNNMLESLPESIGSLKSLEELNLSHNMLNSVPKSIEQLKKVLRKLDISSNQLTGSIPLAVLGIWYLVDLNMSHSKLSESIPEPIGNLSRLIHLNLSHNKLSETIPDSIGNLSKLSVLDISYNSLSGSIPLSLGKLSAVREVHVNDNKDLGGSLPVMMSRTNLQIFMSNTGIESSNALNPIVGSHVIRVNDSSGDTSALKVINEREFELLDAVVLVSDLVENIVALIYTSSSFPTYLIFLIFNILDFLKSGDEFFGGDQLFGGDIKKSFHRTRLDKIKCVILECTQALAYIAISEWLRGATIAFLVLLLAQLSFICQEILKLRREDFSDSSESINSSLSLFQKVQKSFRNLVLLLLFQAFLTIIPTAYPDMWFQVLSTIMLWALFGIGPVFMGNGFLLTDRKDIEESVRYQGELSEKSKYRVGVFFALIYTIFSISSLSQAFKYHPLSVLTAFAAIFSGLNFWLYWYLLFGISLKLISLNFSTGLAKIQSDEQVTEFMEKYKYVIQAVPAIILIVILVNIGKEERE